MAFASSPRALLAVRVSPADVGRRVSLRYADPADDRLTDVVGTLTGWAGGTVTVVRRDDRTVALPARSLVAGKVVPPHVSAYDLQRLAQDGWPPAVAQQWGDWTLRRDDDSTGLRANSVRVGGEAPAPLPDALDQVRAWYASHRARPVLQVPQPWPHDAELDRLGWRARLHVQLLTAPIDRLAAAGADDPAPGDPAPADPAPGGPVRVETTSTPDAAWLAALSDVTADDHEPYRELLTRPAEVGFATARDAQGRLLGIGRASTAALPRAGRWAGISCVETVPAARGRGIAQTVLAALGGCARERGCGHAYLQVIAANGPALRLYERLGFALHHTYAYRAPDEPGSDDRAGSPA